MASIYSDKNSRGWQLRIDYTTAQNVATNKSTINMDLYVYAGVSGSYNNNPNQAYYTIAGAKTFATFSFGSTGWYKLGSRTVEVSHNSDGSGSYTMTGEWCSGITSSRNTPYSLSISGTIQLPTIPRASGVSAPAMVLGTAAVLSVDRKASSFVHTITYSWYGQTGTICTRSSDTSIQWTPPLDLAAKIPNAASGKGSLTITTYSGTTTVGSKTAEFTASVPASVVPSASMSVTAVPGDAVPASWGGVLIRGFSRLAYTVTAAGAQGSTIKEYAATFAGQSMTAASGTTDIIQQAGSRTPSVTVTDSRGRRTSVDGPEQLVYDYAEPTLDAEAYRCNAYGEADDEGTYISMRGRATCTSIGGKNSVTLRGRVRPATGTFGEWIQLDNNTSKVVGGYTAEASYIVEIVAVDALGTEKSVIPPPVPTSEWAFKIRESGKGAAFGKAPEEDDLLDIAWNTRVRKQLRVASIIVDERVSGQATGDAGTITATSYEITKIPLKSWVTAPNAGLSLTEDGGVRIEKAGVYRIGGSIYLTGGANAGMACFIRKGADFDGALEITSNIRSATWSGGVSAPPCIVAADVGEVVYLAARPLGYDATVYTNNVVTFLTLELLSGTAAGNASIVPGALPSENYYVTRPELDAAIAAAIGSIENGKY